tara:strand:+ start:1548 stop:2315 length:768 start_codon:yes stop_codon:yes gene_type:complete
MELRDIKHIVDIDKVLNNPETIQEIRKDIQNGDVYILKNYFSKDLIYSIREYCKRVGQNSIPNYVPIKEGAPNFHRMNRLDKRAYVKGCFHQFSFFPWNQDYFNLFELTKKAYALKNLTSNHEADKFLDSKPEDGCTARLAVQFYPKGNGLLNKHVDPVDKHQLTVPIMIMSEKGKDFIRGGAYVEKDGKKIILDEECEMGDIVYFSAEIPHGVLPIDPEDSTPWLDFQGRWMLLLAVNKVSGNTVIANAKDLES